MTYDHLSDRLRPDARLQHHAGLRRFLHVQLLKELGNYALGLFAILYPPFYIPLVGAVVALTPAWWEALLGCLGLTAPLALLLRAVLKDRNDLPRSAESRLRLPRALLSHG